MPKPPHLRPLNLKEFETPLRDFVNKYPTHADAAGVLGVHPSAITQALADIEANKREVFVRPKKKKGEYVAISVRYFGKHKRTSEGL